MLQLDQGVPDTHTQYKAHSVRLPWEVSLEVVSSTVSSPFTHPALGPQLTRALKLAWPGVLVNTWPVIWYMCVYVCWGKVLNCTPGLSGDANEGWVQE